MNPYREPSPDPRFPVQMSALVRCQDGYVRRIRPLLLVHEGDSFMEMFYEYLRERGMTLCTGWGSLEAHPLPRGY